MVNEDYLACSAYVGQTRHETATDFAAFYQEETQQYFFALLDADGEVLLKSEGYPQPAARENGIQSVIKNRINRDYYSVKEDDGTYYLSLRAGNYREIARSCNVGSEADATALIAYATGEAIRGGVKAEVTAPKERANDRVDDDYMACKAYAGYGGPGNAVVGFSVEGGQHYFAWYDDNGDVLMRSEGYPTTAARNNGMASVEKNLELEERYSILEKMGRYFVILKAGNHQEIARSCPYDSEAAARAIFPSGRAETVRLKRVAAVARLAEQKAAADLKAQQEAAAAASADALLAEQEAAAASAAAALKVEQEAAASAAALLAEQEAAAATLKAEAAAVVAASAATIVATPVVETITTTPVEAEPVVDIEDDYLPCREYRGHMTAPRDGFRVFLHNNNKYYFAVVDAHDDVTLRSEGHLTADERNADMQDVINNMLKKERYNIKKVGLHHYFVVLRNAEGKEIARSCALDSLTSVYNLAPFLNPEKPTVKVDMAPKLEFTTAATTVTAATIVGTASRTLETVIAPTIIGAPMVIETVIAPAPIIKETIISEPVVVETPVIVAPVVEAIAPVVVEAPVVETVAPVVTPSVPVDIEDDYLPCREYEGRTMNDKANNVAMFKHSNGQFYFAVYNTDGGVRLRSEGFHTSQERDKELSGVLKNLNNADMYSTIRRGDYYINILKDKTGREVGRSCMQKDAPAPVAAPVVATALAAAAIALPEVEVPTVTVPEVKIEVPTVTVPEVKVEVPKVEYIAPKVTTPPPVYVAPEVVEPVATETGFNWWWVLLPLLGLLAWWFTGRGCNKPVPAPTAVTVAPTAPLPVETPKTIESTTAAVPAVPSAPSCDLNWILFDFDKADIRADAKAELAQMAKILKENKDYVGVLSAHTDGKGTAAYNDALSLRRAAAAKKTLVAMGIGAARLKTQADGKDKPIAQNTTDDAGRQFNRRVELYIQDKNGKNICESIAPNVPDALKAK